MAKAKLNRRKHHMVYGPGRGRDIIIQDGFFFSASGSILPKNEAKLLELGYGKLLPNGKRALHPKVLDQIERVEVEQFKSREMMEIQKEVEAFEARLKAKRAQEAEEQKRMELEAEKAGVDGTAKGFDNEDEAARAPTDADFDLDLSDLEAEVIG